MRRRRLGLGVVLLVCGAVAVAVGLSGLEPGRGAPEIAQTPSPTARPTEPIVPPRPTATRAPSPSLTPASQPDLSRQAIEATIPVLEPALYTLRQRLGVGAASLGVTDELAEKLGFGWYLDWNARADPSHSMVLEYVPMIRPKGGNAQPSGDKLAAAVAGNQGALWLIGNEPDVRWQDGIEAEAYARLYHDMYAALKDLDPACQVGIGGVSQPTPLRLDYLDLVLEAYVDQFGEPMPVDVWNIHNFILREERDGWGVDIPPGMPEQVGVLREIADHDNLRIFQEQIMDMRQWMRERGEQDKPLIVSEFGILMPEDYGFPPERVAQFMLDTFEFMRTATDPENGYPADGNRLVQRWCWYSLADTVYPTGNLVSSENGGLTSIGRAFRTYAHSTP